MTLVHQIGKLLEGLGLLGEPWSLEIDRPVSLRSNGIRSCSYQYSYTGAYISKIIRIIYLRNLSFLDYL